MKRIFLIALLILVAPVVRSQPGQGLPGGRTLSFNFESSYDWKGDAWNVPMNIGYSKVVKAGSQLLSLQGGLRYYFETPGDGPDWGVRFTLTLLYPGK